VLNVNAKIDIDSIDIYNLNGQLLISKKIGALSAEIDLSTFSNGLYFATIMTANNQTETFKVIKD
jgi:hypothetical protein